MTRFPTAPAAFFNRHLHDPHAAERLVAEGHGDLAAVGSAMLADPDWTAHAREVLTD